ncbi:MAG: hypothetical protein ABIR57_11355 [Aeromicrobium sp.]
MEDLSAVAIDSYRWRTWTDAASSVQTAAKRLANAGFVLVTLVAAGFGAMTLRGEWRYSAIVYAPVLGFLMWEAIESSVAPVRFRPVAQSMREVLVPDLVDAIDDSRLLQLARFKSARVSGQTIRVIDEGGYVQFVIAGEDEDFGADWGTAGGGDFGDMGYAGGDSGGGGDGGN